MMKTTRSTGKKITELLLAAVLLISCMIATGVSVSAYVSDEPSIYHDNYRMEAYVGDVVEIKYSYFPEYTNEIVYVNVYEPSGVCVASSERTFYNTSSSEKSYTVTWDTKDEFSGEYKVVAKVSYYSGGMWMDSSNTTSATITVKEKNPAGASVSNPIVLQNGVQQTKYWTSQNQHLNCYNKISVPSRGYIAFEIDKPRDTEGEAGSFDLALYSTDGKLQWKGTTDGLEDSFSDKYLMKIGVKAGTYYLNIEPNFTVQSNSAPIKVSYKYNFTANNYWEIEPNGVAYLATEIALNKTYYGVYCEETFDSEDQDWFKVKLTAGKTYKISFGNFDELVKNAIIYLIDPNNSDSSLEYLFDHNGQYNGTVKYITYEAETSGTYYIKIYNCSDEAPVEYTLNITEMHIHAYASKVTKAATCTKTGVMTYTCSCGSSYTKSIPATGKHTYKTTTTKATTSKDGKTVTACTVCGKVSKNTVIPKVTSFKLSATKYTYNGKTQTPTVTVKDSKGKTLKKDKDYTVSYASGRKNTGKYSVKITLKGNYSGTKTLYYNILPGKTSKLTATQTDTSVKATWKAVTGASGYQVTLYTAKNKAVKTVNTTKTTVTFTKLSKGTTYKVKVTAYKTIDKKNVNASVYTLITTATKPGTPTLKVTAGSKKATLSWNKQTGAAGYVVYMATSKDGKFSKIATVKGNSKVSYTKTELTKGKTYYFKVAAYSSVDGKTITGAYSSVKSVKVK